MCPVATAGLIANWKTGNGNTAENVKDLQKREGGQKCLGEEQLCQRWGALRQNNQLIWPRPLAPWGNP